MADPQDRLTDRCRIACRIRHRVGQVEAGRSAFHEPLTAARQLHDNLHESIRARYEPAIGIRGEQRHVPDIVIGECDPQHQRIGLHVGPCRQRA